MKRRVAMQFVDILLATTFVAAWVTHEAAVLTHSLVSLLFAGVAVVHAKRNWRTFRRSRKSKSWSVVPDVGIILGLVLVTLSGLILWIGDVEVWHGLSAGILSVAVAPHVWIHRRSLARLLGGAVGLSRGAGKGPGRSRES